MRRIKFILLSGLLFLAPHLVAAQANNPYQLTGSLSAGGGIVSGGSYQVGVALGQPGAGEVSGGGYTLGSGLFGGGQVTQAPPTPTPSRQSVYLPLAQR